MFCCKGKMERRVKISLGITIAGLVILILGTVLGWAVMPLVIDSVVKKQVQLKNGSLIYEKWKDIPLPVHLSAYFYNVTNPEDFVGGVWGAKPVLREVGPYVYREKRVKYEIQSHPNRDTISYRQNITYTFVPEMSVGSDERDALTILNAPLVAIASILSTIEERLLPIPHRAFIELFMGPLSRDTFLKEGVIIKDIMFGVRLNFVYDVVLFLLELILALTLPPELSNGRFGPFVDKNGTNADGLWEIWSGIEDHTKVNTLRSINGVETIGPQNVSYWEGECNEFNGGDGIFFPPFIKKDQKLWQHSVEICRGAWVEFDKESEYRGIPTYRFQAQRNLFQTPEEYRPNWCYCVEPRPPLDGTCPPTGVSRVRSCKTGAPVVVSKPHFLDGDQVLFDMIDGIDPPSSELHDTFAEIEPLLGVPLKGVKRLQVNVETQAFETMGPEFKTLNHRFWPYMWIQEAAELNDELYDELNSKYLTPLKIANAGRWVAVGLGTLGTILGGLALGYFAYWKR